MKTESTNQSQLLQNPLAGGVSSEFRKFAYPHATTYTHAKGTRITDLEGNEFLDFTLSQGPLILGHSHPDVISAVTETIQTGQLFAGQHAQELELAEKLQALIPCAESMRFSLSGSEADHAALRLARGLTGRPKFMRFEGHYHGWFDNVAWGLSAPDEDALGPRENPNRIPWSKGLPPGVEDEFILLPWNDLQLVKQTLEKRHTEIAAIITEPVMCNNGCIMPRPGYLEGLRELCDQFGIVLIFDEVITGFRLGMGGAQQFFGVTPDLAVFGKAMASGFPISVLCGKKEFMQPIADGEVIHAGTMNSGQPSVAAALATVKVLEAGNAHERIFSLGEKLRDGIQDAGRQAGLPLLVQGPGPMFHVGFTERKAVCEFRECFAYDKPRYAAFVAAMHEQGIRLIGRGLWYVSAVHTEDEVETAIRAAACAFERLAAGPAGGR